MRPTSKRIGICALGLFFAVMLSSCAAISSLKPDPDQGAFIGAIPRSYADVWKAAVLSLDQFPLEVVDHDRGFIRTGWIQGWGDKKFGALASLGSGGSWQRRARGYVWLHPAGDSTAVKVHLEVEEKPPGGAMANRWSRVGAQPEQVKDVFRDIEAECAKIKPGA